MTGSPNDVLRMNEARIEVQSNPDRAVSLDMKDGKWEEIKGNIVDLNVAITATSQPSCCGEVNDKGVG